MKIRIQKNELTAETGYDFRRLEEKNHLFLPCRIEEEKETVLMHFDLQGMRSFEELKDEEIFIRLTALIQVAELREVYRKYEFSLDPGNLYYDMLGRIKVRSRDVISSAAKNRAKNFLKQYQALAGYLLDGIRLYEDYLHGSPEFFTGNPGLLELMKSESVQEIQKILSEYYGSLCRREKESMKRVERRKYNLLVYSSIVSAFFLLLLLTMSAYGFLWKIPRQNKLLAAEDAYLRKDYEEMIDKLRGFSADELERADKYMLAAAYIQGQSIDTFSAGEKEYILSKVTYQSNENVLDYWIHLGRLEVEEAKNLAMKLSDDQLLLYASMHELRQVEDDGELSGEEKRRRQQELMKEIEELADKLGISYENEERES